ncbi:MAG TPA: hypothetical protein VE783_02550 [Candidatus Limnocylindrales bacterium]|jgi:ABC-type dipeptide/oligopeptide/nickel transport system ATPase subunit|nr:hypothetical protein [Candidatus Limnocylindrales bacterium]
MPGAAESLLIITGSMGSGKSSVLAEASDILTLRKAPHAAIDLDALSLGHFRRSDDSDQLMYANLQSVWQNFAAAGITRLLLARALETCEELELTRSAVSAKHVTICRLTAEIATMEQRVRQRESGILQQQFVERVSVLNALIDRAALEDFCVANQDRPIHEVATEMLSRAGWL